MTKIQQKYRIDIDHLTYIMYENSNKLQKWNGKKLCR